MRDFIIHQSPGSSAAHQFFDHSLTQLAILMMQYGPGSNLRMFPSTSKEGPVKAVIEALKESFTCQWSLDQMAQVAKVNKYQLSHFFKEETGLSPYLWLQLYRLFHSQKFLAYTNKTIVSIALDHGFSSVAAYNHLFKKVYRKTPTEFRKVHGYT
ncbi:helix-turn-helix transcriptional regulator [Halobacillus andaensis]|uniref:helix-turn-helix transcriptional regulator n=1 Tax=Halobacillus andaensis TaxID=1176239 RepID=UPI003D716540